MDSSNRLVLVILGVPILALAYTFLTGSQTDRARFDRLEIGMTPAQAKAIAAPDPPRSRRFPAARHFRMDWGDDDTVQLNDRMVLTFRNGRLVHKKWIGDPKEK